MSHGRRVAMNLSRDQLRRRRRREYFGPWLPSPVLTEGDDGFALDHRAVTESTPVTALLKSEAVFQELIRISPASHYMEELVASPGGLLSRGLLEDHATSYGALPRTKQQRTALAGILNHYVCAHFPEYAKFHSGAGVIGVPGFWQELSGVVHIWNPTTFA